MGSAKLNQSSNVLFGDCRQGALWALRFPFDRDENFEPTRGTIALLLSRSGRFASDERNTAVRSATGHEGIAIVFERSVLTRLLEPFRPGLRPALRTILSTETAIPVFEPEIQDEIRTALFESLISPKVEGPGLAFYYEGKIREFLAHGSFGVEKGGEFFCTRQKRLSMDRVAKAADYLRSHLDAPLDLAKVAQAAGCSACYLSRTFSATSGMTLSQFFRKCRIERAAELLATGRFNVGEVAVEVGYQSFSHFSKAFRQETGRLPSDYEAA